MYEHVYIIEGAVGNPVTSRTCRFAKYMQSKALPSHLTLSPRWWKMNICRTGVHTAAHEAAKIAIVLMISTESSAACTPAMTLPDMLRCIARTRLSKREWREAGRRNRAVGQSGQRVKIGDTAGSAGDSRGTTPVAPTLPGSLWPRRMTQ